MLSVRHVSDAMSDAKIYKSIVRGLFKTKIYALLLDFVFLKGVKLPIFPPATQVMKMRRNEKGWNHALMENSMQLEGN
jgi:hypothetical protein